jgi:hypothetical protein
MTYRHRRRKVLSVLAGIPMIAATLLVGGMQPGSQAQAAGCPPGVCAGILRNRQGGHACGRQHCRHRWRGRSS